MYICTCTVCYGVLPLHVLRRREEAEGSSDSEYDATREEGEEDEEEESTIAEQEKHEGELDHSSELTALQAEGAQNMNGCERLG